MQISILLPIIPFIVGMVVAAPYVVDERQVAKLLHYQVSDALRQLDANNQVDWIEVEGGRRTFITHEQGIAALNNATTRRDLGTNPLHARWQKVGQIEGYDTEEECFKSGTSVVVNLVKANFGSACSAFFGSTPVGLTIDSGWNIFQKSGIADISGANAVINYRWANSGVLTEVKPTEAVCNLAADELLGGTCTGSGQTRGADIKIAKNLGWILGFDPNSV